MDPFAALISSMLLNQVVGAPLPAGFDPVFEEGGVILSLFFFTPFSPVATRTAVLPARTSQMTLS